MSGIKDLAAKGRNGDNTLMHVSTDEVAGLNALARETMGQNLTTNPETGLPEAFLFAPLAAPLVAGGMGLGTGAIATGLTAGALGAAEAELRDMDDPLRRGLYSGLTAGAMSGIGNALSGAAEAGQAAGQAGQAGSQAATTAASGPDISQAVAGSQTGFNVTNPTASGPSFSGAGQMSVAGATPAAPAAQPSITTMGPSGGVTGGASIQPPTPSMPQPTTAPTTGSPTLDPQQAFQQSQYADVPQMAEGAKNIFRDEAARQQFMGQVRMPATAGAVGLGGQAQLNRQDAIKERQEAADREKAAELKAAQDRIRANYASVGRPLPTNISGQPVFADGGIVKLRRGGGLGDGGGRAANQGGMGGSSGGGSRGGGGGGSRGGGGSTHPGRPGGESGERSMSRGGGGGGGGAAVQSTTPQLDPKAIENAVISPMDRFSQGIKDLAMMSPTVRALSYLGRDRRALGGSSPHGPGAPVRDPSSGMPEGAGGGGDSLRRIPQPQTAEPTLPLVAERTPTKNEQDFLAALQQGAGNRAAMQQTGYGMAEGGIVGLFGGGQIQKVADKASDGSLPQGGGVISKVVRAVKGQEGSSGTTSQKDADFERFLAELQKGAGNRAAMQRTGYTGMASGGYLDGGMLPGDGMSDDVPATINGNQPAALSSGEFVVPADVVSHIGNGSSDAGAKQLYAMMDRIREARTGEDDQAPEINPRKMMPK